MEPKDPKGKKNAEKILEHPTFKLRKRIEEQEEEIRDLKIEVAVIKDLLVRTLKLMAKYEKAGLFKLPGDESFEKEMKLRTLKLPPPPKPEKT